MLDIVRQSVIFSCLGILRHVLAGSMPAKVKMLGDAKGQFTALELTYRLIESNCKRRNTAVDFWSTFTAESASLFNSRSTRGYEEHVGKFISRKASLFHDNVTTTFKAAQRLQASYFYNTQWLDPATCQPAISCISLP